MIIKCIYDSYGDVPPKPERDPRVLPFAKSKCNYITKDKLYVVYGIIHEKIDMFYEGVDFAYYIIDDFGFPSSVPARMFEVLCPHLYGEGWTLKHYDDATQINFIFGHERFATDVEFYDRFAERDDYKAKERHIFMEWKNKIDKAIQEGKCHCCQNVDEVILSGRMSEHYTKDIKL